MGDVWVDKMAARIASNGKIWAHVAPVVRKDHWKPSVSRRTKITFSSGHVTTETTTPVVKK